MMFSANRSAEVNIHAPRPVTDRMEAAMRYTGKSIMEYRATARNVPVLKAMAIETNM